VLAFGAGKMIDVADELAVRLENPGADVLMIDFTL
jgi:hypothetical protein